MDRIVQWVFVAIFLVCVLGLLGVVGIGALVGITTLQVHYYYPWKHERNTAAAEAENDTIWSEGEADLYARSGDRCRRRSANVRS